MHANAISIVVRTYNSGKSLGKLLQNLFLMASDELIIVDSGSQDSTLDIARKYGAEIVLASLPFSYSKSLNQGFRVSKCPWVLVMSSHSIPQVDDLLSIYRREIVRLPENVVVGYGPSSLSGKSDPQINANEATFYDQNSYDAVSHICGNANTIYRRRAWEELAFDETIRTAEDKIWIAEMISRGYRFAYLPSSITLNRNQASLVYMFRKGLSDSRALSRITHPPMTFMQLLGALKNMMLDRLSGEIGWSNWARYSAHTFGQYFGSRGEQNNRPQF